MALTLSGCVTSGQIPKPVYPVLPVDIRLCFETLVPAPPPGPLSKAQVVKLIANLKASEAEKTDCGKRLIEFYDGLSLGA